MISTLYVIPTGPRIENLVALFALVCKVCALTAITRKCSLHPTAGHITLACDYHDCLAHFLSSLQTLVSLPSTSSASSSDLFMFYTTLIVLFSSCDAL